MRINIKFEGESLQDGVNIYETIYFNVVTIRVDGRHHLHIAIPKANPKKYSIEEETRNKWDQRLWL